jgi:hypothetical protein
MNSKAWFGGGCSGFPDQPGCRVAIGFRRIPVGLAHEGPVSGSSLTPCSCVCHGSSSSSVGSHEGFDLAVLDGVAVAQLLVQLAAIELEIEGDAVGGRRLTQEAVAAAVELAVEEPADRVTPVERPPADVEARRGARGMAVIPGSLSARPRCVLGVERGRGVCRRRDEGRVVVEVDLALRPEPQLLLRG